MYSGWMTCGWTDGRAGRWAHGCMEIPILGEVYAWVGGGVDGFLGRSVSGGESDCSLLLL